MLFKQILKPHHIEVKTVWTKTIFSPSIICYLLEWGNEREHNCSFHLSLGSFSVGSLSPLLQFLRGFVSTVRKRKKASSPWGLNWSVWSCKVWYEVIRSICWQGVVRQAVNLHVRVKQDNKGTKERRSWCGGAFSDCFFTYLFICSFFTFSTSLKGDRVVSIPRKEKKYPQSSSCWQHPNVKTGFETDPHITAERDILCL